MEFKTKTIKFSSRTSIKKGDSYFTFEATIEKECPEECTENEYNEAKHQLWDEVNAEIDNQIIELEKYLKQKQN